MSEWEKRVAELLPLLRIADLNTAKDLLRAEFERAELVGQINALEHMKRESRSWFGARAAL